MHHRFVTPARVSLTIFMVFGAASNATSQSCHDSYTGACVPIASDVDCAAGSGNGPAYVAGPVRVVGPDVYGLDRDSDGIGCENG